MADDYVKLAQGQLPTTVGTLYTVPADGVIIRNITLTNPSGGAATAKLHDVDSGDSAGDDNVILAEKTMQDGETTVSTGPFTNSTSGDLIQGVSDTATAITYTIYGVEINP